MPTFQSFTAYRDFEREVIGRRRFAQSKAGQDFLMRFRKSARERLTTLQRGHPLWRAQIGAGSRMHSQTDEHDNECEYEVTAPFSVERMSPDPKFVRDGRSNPRGIAYRYLAKNEKTAIAEVRPWLGAYVSVGVFEVLEDCKVVYCLTTKHSPFVGTILWDGGYKPPAENEWDDIVWGDIGYAFAEPPDPESRDLTYAPTQILAEVLHEEGHDGVLYRSAMNRDGYNVALFDPQRARLFACAIHRVSAVTYASGDVEEGYGRPRETATPTPADSAPAVER